MEAAGIWFLHFLHLWPVFLIHFINLQLEPHLPREYSENSCLHCSLEMPHPTSCHFLVDIGLVVYLRSRIPFKNAASHK